MMDGILILYITVTGVYTVGYNYKFAHKSGIVWKIYLIKLYICSANCPNTMFWIASMAPEDCH
jgi:ribose/xylose/arabinose/galactoside ABC-type transport system permease subunit